jgi:hypothetical protein
MAKTNVDLEIIDSLELKRNKIFIVWFFQTHYISSISNEVNNREDLLLYIFLGIFGFLLIFISTFSFFYWFIQKKKVFLYLIRVRPYFVSPGFGKI